MVVEVEPAARQWHRVGGATERAGEVGAQLVERDVPLAVLLDRGEALRQDDVPTDHDLPRQADHVAVLAQEHRRGGVLLRRGVGRHRPAGAEPSAHLPGLARQHLEHAAAAGIEREQVGGLRVTDDRDRVVLGGHGLDGVRARSGAPHPDPTRPEVRQQPPQPPLTAPRHQVDHRVVAALRGQADVQPRGVVPDVELHDATGPPRLDRGHGGPHLAIDQERDPRARQVADPSVELDQHGGPVTRGLSRRHSRTHAGRSRTGRPPAAASPGVKWRRKSPPPPALRWSSSGSKPRRSPTVVTSAARVSVRPMKSTCRSPSRR